MLLFSTLLSINKRMSKDDFIKLVIKWNQESPHQDNVIPGIRWEGDYNVRFGDDNLWLAIEEYRNGNIVAVRYEKRDTDGVVWDTDYVVNFDEHKISIRLDRSFTQEISNENRGFSTPHFITLLINEGYLENDGDLSVQKMVHNVGENDIPALAEIINGHKRYQLPVVYVSRTVTNREPVNSTYMASRLKGIAHVLLQESHNHNYKLRSLCNDRNDYNGAIGIYYPSASTEPRKFMFRNSAGYDDFLMENVCRTVIQHSSAKMLNALYTWQGVNNAILRDRLQAQREERIAAENAWKNAEEENGRILDSLDEEEKRIRKEAREEAVNEARAIIETTDEEIEDLRRRIEDLTKANDSLQFENEGLRAKLNQTASIPILHMGDEYEVYQGEIKDLVLTVLEKASSNLPQNSRRMHVIQDVIQSNDFKHQTKRNAELAKELLGNYTRMSSKLQQDLERLGFKISEDGKHYKLKYNDEGRYTITIAKTPSDGRSGMNTVHELIKLVF